MIMIQFPSSGNPSNHPASIKVDAKMNIKDDNSRFPSSTRKNKLWFQHHLEIDDDDDDDDDDGVDGVDGVDDS